MFQREFLFSCCFVSCYVRGLYLQPIDEYENLFVAFLSHWSGCVGVKHDNGFIVLQSMCLSTIDTVYNVHLLNRPFRRIKENSHIEQDETKKKYISQSKYHIVHTDIRRRLLHIKFMDSKYVLHRTQYDILVKSSSGKGQMGDWFGDDLFY